MKSIKKSWVFVSILILVIVVLLLSLYLLTHESTTILKYSPPKVPVDITKIFPQLTESTPPSVVPEKEEEQTSEPIPLPNEINRGDSSKKQVIFTFDAGAGNQSLNVILTTLKNHNLTGTFFITGKWAEQNPKLVKQISDNGNEIFNHTYDHPDLVKTDDSLIIKELQDTEDIIEQLTGKTTKPYFRPPYGSRNTHVRQLAWDQGYRCVYWTVDALDWKETSGITKEEVKQRIYNNVTPGAIYLMHVGDNITGEILDEVFTYIEGKGYKIVPLSQGL